MEDLYKLSLLELFAVGVILLLLSGFVTWSLRSRYGHRYDNIYGRRGGGWANRLWNVWVVFTVSFLMFYTFGTKGVFGGTAYTVQPDGTATPHPDGVVCWKFSSRCYVD